MNGQTLGGSTMTIIEILDKALDNRFRATGDYLISHNDANYAYWHNARDGNHSNLCFRVNAMWLFEHECATIRNGVIHCEGLECPVNPDIKKIKRRLVDMVHKTSDQTIIALAIQFGIAAD
jgi:hypothetical protein